MFDKVLDIVKTRDLVVPGSIFFKKEELGLSYEEIYILIYIFNLSDLEFDMVKMSDDLGINPKEIITIVNDLVEKDYVKLETKTKEDRNTEYFNLDGLYNKLVFNIIGKEIKKEEVKEEKEMTLFEEFEHEFKRPLTPKEFQFINAWKEIGYSEELISLALKEASYNGAYNISYIDKVLSAWDAKGIKTKADVEKNRQEYSKRTLEEDDDSDDDYDWLNE